MATDRNGKTVVTGDAYVVAGTCRRVDGDSVLIVQNVGNDIATRVTAGEVVAVDDLLDPPIRLPAKNTSGVTINKGVPVYVTGSVGASVQVEVAASDASNAAKMPAIGVLETTLAANEEGHVIAVGVVRGLNTGGYAINQTLFVAPGGGLTNVRPTATSDLVQNLARVTRVHASTGEILVLGAGRTNDVPNYAATTLLGRGSASGAGPAQEITVGNGLSLSGTTLSSTGGGGGSNEVKFASGGMTNVNVASTTLVDLVSKTMTVAAGDTLEIELVGTITNNSGATRTYTFEAELGAFGVTCLDGTTVAASATNRAPIKLRAVYSVASTSSAGVVVFSERAAPGAADTGLSIATTTYRHAWHTSASNLTGSQAIKMRCLSSAATATQTFTVHSFIVRQYAQAL